MVDNDAILEEIYEELFEEGYEDCWETALLAIKIFQDRAK